MLRRGKTYKKGDRGEKMRKEIYDVIIVGGGITGASLLYTLTRYTKIKKILLLEKYDDLATLNSNSRNNAQTLHFGDIETNYSFEEAARIKNEAERVLRYFKLQDPRVRNETIKKCQKMVLGIGGEEIEFLDELYKTRLKRLFPSSMKLERKDIARLEPYVVRNRSKDEEIGALLSKTGYMIDFGKMTHMFASQAESEGGGRARILFNARVMGMEKKGSRYRVYTSKNEYFSRFVVFATGSYSLYFAKSIGIDKNLSILSVGGGFYTSKRVLNGKVYRVQKGGIPFAAVHGDPDIADENITRFGPTVNIPPMLEKKHLNTVIDYIKTFDFDMPTMVSLEKILFNKDIKKIIANNIGYGIPVIGKYSFLKKEAARIVPSLKYGNLKLHGDIGGIRPQMIDENKQSLVLGAGKIKHDGVIFNITPSPGASSCLANSLKDMQYISDYLGEEFNKSRYEAELGKIDN